MTNQHTQGPWVYDDVWGLITAKDVQVCALHSGIKANAHLIAAAPELLEALEALWGYSRWCSDTNHVPNFEQDDMGGHILRIIAKAKGETNA